MRSRLFFLFLLTGLLFAALVSAASAQDNINSCTVAPRLVIGQSARVAFTDGADLNIRSAPAGEYIMQIPEGTMVTVVEGPVCANDYLWWNLSLGNGTGGWAAEGDSSAYFIEPFTVQLATPMPLAPTATPIPRADLNQPIPQPPVECLESPPSQLAVGMLAEVVGTDGTLAMFVNVADEFPTYQLPIGTTVTLVGGATCRQGIRVWQVVTTINNAPVVGWAAEGFGQLYFLMPVTLDPGVLIAEPVQPESPDVPGDFAPVDGGVVGGSGEIALSPEQHVPACDKGAPSFLSVGMEVELYTQGYERMHYDLTEKLELGEHGLSVLADMLNTTPLLVTPFVHDHLVLTPEQLFGGTIAPYGTVVGGPECSESDASPAPEPGEIQEYVPSRFVTWWEIEVQANGGTYTGWYPESALQSSYWLWESESQFPRTLYLYFMRPAE